MAFICFDTDSFDISQGFNLKLQGLFVTKSKLYCTNLHTLITQALAVLIIACSSPHNIITLLLQQHEGTQVYSTYLLG